MKLQGIFAICRGAIYCAQKWGYKFSVIMAGVARINLGAISCAPYDQQSHKSAKPNFRLAMKQQSDDNARLLR
ncbi:hypothetical protein D0C16_07495 [Cellvibrio sp. KY-GH-1]|nr:hypothetical protein D0C16_07495 [Cellvibrio sp. KY-GH-1]